MSPIESRNSASPFPVVLSRGYRIFFLLAGVYAVISVGAWVALYLGWTSFATGFTPPFWHAHEMLFGYTAAAIAGFLMTAVPNWTGTAPMQGWPLAGLAGLWLLGRIAVWLGPWLPATLVAAADLALFPALILVVGRVLYRTRNPRQLVFIVALAILFLANLHTYLPILGSDPGRGLIVAIDIVTLLIVVIGGRITPNFTASVLRLTESAPRIVTLPWLDRVAILSVAALALADLLAVPEEVRGGVSLMAGILNAARFAGYRTRHTIRRPILWVLHVGYAWAVLGLVLKGAASFFPDLPPTVALHALTVGAIGTMTLGVMSRACLGHTGREIRASFPIVVAYVLASIAAIVRVFTAVVMPAVYVEAIAVSGALWVMAFALFVIVYAPIFLRARPDGRAG